MTRLRGRRVVMVVVRLIIAEPMFPADASARRTAASLRIPNSIAMATGSLAVHGPSAPVRRLPIASAGLGLTCYPLGWTPFASTRGRLDLELFDLGTDGRVIWSRTNTSSSQSTTVGMVLRRMVLPTSNPM
jgi:hypothetical protein